MKASDLIVAILGPGVLVRSTRTIQGRETEGQQNLFVKESKRKMIAELEARFPNDGEAHMTAETVAGQIRVTSTKLIGHVTPKPVLHTPKENKERKDKPMGMRRARNTKTQLRNEAESLWLQ